MSKDETKKKKGIGSIGSLGKSLKNKIFHKSTANDDKTEKNIPKSIPTIKQPENKPSTTNNNTNTNINNNNQNQKKQFSVQLSKDPEDGEDQIYILNDEDEDEEYEDDEEYEQESQTKLKETKPKVQKESETSKYSNDKDNITLPKTQDKPKVCFIPQKITFIKDIVPDITQLKLRDIDTNSYCHYILKKNNYIDIAEVKVIHCTHIKNKKALFSSKKTKQKSNKSYLMFDEEFIYIIKDKEISKQNKFLRKVKDKIRFKHISTISLKTYDTFHIEIIIEIYANDYYLIDETEKANTFTLLISKDDLSTFNEFISFYIKKEKIKNNINK